MKKKRYAEEQIAFALRQSEAGTPVAEVIRKMGISEQTRPRPTSDAPRSHRWKKHYAGLAARLLSLTVIAQQKRTRSGSTRKPSDSHTFLHDGHGSTRGLIFQRSFANKLALKTSPDQSL
jgi:putative transposase